MIYWLLTIILAYLFFGFASLCDKLVLAGKPKPKSYTFYVGVFSLVVILLIPFTKFGFPNASGLTWIILDAMVHVVGLYTMYVAIEKFDVSRVIATIGATQPIFIFVLTWFLGGPQKMPEIDILAFVFLLLGSIIISIEKNIKITSDYLKITIFSSMMFSLDYIFAKFVFLSQTFLPGIIWIGIFIFLFALTLLFKKDSRKEIFAKQIVLNKKTDILFLCAQASGGVGNFLQSLAISLAPIAFLATVNSLRGIQYVFLFLMTLFISYFYPKILKEELSKKIILKKMISIILRAVGLVMLVY
jgi:drug/metabolite transporter (DMT)-like permease